MKLGDLGINKKGMHDARLTRAENIFLGLMWLDHVGEENAIAADRLAVLFANALEGRDMNRKDLPAVLRNLKSTRGGWNILNGWKRDVRRMHNHLLKDHSRVAILSKAGYGGGYWIAESEAEAREFYHTFRKRGLTGLVKASRGQKAVLVDMVQQLSFDFELDDKTGLPAPGRPGSEVSMPAEVVDRFIEKMLEHPEKFADDLRKLGQKFSGVLLPKEKAREIKETAGRLSALMAEL